MRRKEPLLPLPLLSPRFRNVVIRLFWVVVAVVRVGRDDDDDERSKGREEEEEEAPLSTGY